MGRPGAGPRHLGPVACVRAAGRADGHGAGGVGSGSGGARRRGSGGCWLGQGRRQEQGGRRGRQVVTRQRGLTEELLGVFQLTSNAAGSSFGDCRHPECRRSRVVPFRLSQLKRADSNYWHFFLRQLKVWSCNVYGGLPKDSLPRATTDPESAQACACTPPRRAHSHLACRPPLRDWLRREEYLAAVPNPQKPTQ